MTVLTVSTSSAVSLPADSVVIGVAEGPGGPVVTSGAEEVAGTFDGELAGMLGSLGMTGADGEVVRLLAPAGIAARVVLAVGLGAAGEDGALDAEALRRAAGAAARALAGTGRAVLALPVDSAEAAEAVALGSLLGAYAFTSYLTGQDCKYPVSELVITANLGNRLDLEAGMLRGTVIAEELNRCRDLVNTPPNELHPESFATAVEAVGKEFGLTVEVLDEAALAEAGFGGILGVGRGSARPPRLVRIVHDHPAATTRLALVGKGITYDSGGISLKPVGFNEIMKRDMAGAAAVLAAVVAARRLDLRVHLTGWLALAENMPSGSALRPGDVLRMYGGKTVEVLNTDAEGRLVLADTMVRAGEDEPDAIVDVATLTAAVRIALGNHVFAVMSDDVAFRDRVVAAAAAGGEPAWPMPLPAELLKGLKSAVADIANSGERVGGGLAAGLFLKEFVPEGTVWAHLDIAGPAFNEGAAHGYTPTGGTGSAVRTLIRLAQEAAAGDDFSEGWPGVPPLDFAATDAAPAPLGHYSQAAVTPDGTVWVSAQLPLGSGIHPESAVADQARQALANVVAIAESAGAAVHSIAKITVYLTDVSDWETVDAVVGEMLGEHRPARAVLQIAGLHHGFSVAVDAVAWKVAP